MIQSTLVAYPGLDAKALEQYVRENVMEKEKNLKASAIQVLNQMKSQLPSDRKNLDEFIQNYLKQTISTLEVSALQKTKIITQAFKEEIQEKIDEEIGKKLAQNIDKHQQFLSQSYYNLVHSIYYRGMVAEQLAKKSE